MSKENIPPMLQELIDMPDSAFDDEPSLVGEDGFILLSDYCLTSFLQDFVILNSINFGHFPDNKYRRNDDGTYHVENAYTMEWEARMRSKLNQKAKQRSCQLYRHFDEAGELLYVGISINFMARLGSHRNTCNWFDQIATIKVEHYPTVYEAEAAELHAIRTELPKHNIAGVDKQNTNNRCTK